MADEKVRQAGSDETPDSDAGQVVTTTTTSSNGNNEAPKATIVQVNPVPTDIFTPYRPLFDALQAGAWAIVLFCFAVIWLARHKIAGYFDGIMTRLEKLIAVAEENKATNEKTTEELKRLEEQLAKIQQSNLKNGKVLVTLYRIGLMFEKKEQDSKSGRL